MITLREVLREHLRGGLAKAVRLSVEIPAGATVDVKASPPEGFYWVCLSDRKGDILLNIFDLTLIKDAEVLYSMRVGADNLEVVYNPHYLTKRYCIWRIKNNDAVPRTYEMTVFFSEYLASVIAKEEEAVKAGA